jgi:hypothetical protein
MSLLHRRFIVYFLQVYVILFVMLVRDLFKSEVPELDF